MPPLEVFVPAVVVDVFVLWAVYAAGRRRGRRELPPEPAREEEGMGTAPSRWGAG